MSESATTRFEVDLGDVEIDDAAAQKLGSTIQSIVLRHLADLNLARPLVIGRLGPGTVGLIAVPPIEADAFRLAKSARSAAKGRVFQVDLGDIKLSADATASISREIGTAALEAVGPAGITAGTAVLGKLGPGLDGYRMRRDLRGALKSIAGLQG